MTSEHLEFSSYPELYPRPKGRIHFMWMLPIFVLGVLLGVSLT